MSKIEKLKKMIDRSKSISGTIRYDNLDNVKVEPFHNSNVRIEGDILIIEKIGKQIEINEDFIKIDGEIVDIKCKEKENNRPVIVRMVIR